MKRTKEYKKYMLLVSYPVIDFVKSNIEKLSNDDVTREFLDQNFSEIFEKLNETIINDIAWNMAELDEFTGKPYRTKEELLADDLWVLMVKNLVMHQLEKDYKVHKHDYYTHFYYSIKILYRFEI